ncbi:MAG: UvrD-helicase domain-containing protein, partial [Eggerthellaceae bacterium]|nr:UvrD-helicase domain-containing protein [Eggerthellaceae bacterium]
MPIDLSSLNPPQREAVLCTEGPLLVLAGAGSGKTRVLTYRIAHLVEDLGVHPWQILAITFTNKAANEMRERLYSLVGPDARGMWVSTFHSMCGRILRANAEYVGRTGEFTIYDEDDMKRLMKRLMEELDLNPKQYNPKAIAFAISQAKNGLVMPEDLEQVASDPFHKAVARVYARMEERLQAANAFDFDGMLLYTYLLLKRFPEVLAAYQRRFAYVLVDEYQDTNRAQYAITALLAGLSRNIMVVGDDD